jgi:tetratricopeptide (TPR) repeat protein
MPRQKSDHVDSAEALAGRLREARRRAGLSQRSLARDICTPAYVSRLEKGERIPSLQLLRRLASRLGVDADELASGVPNGSADPLLDAELAFRLGEVEEAESLFTAALQVDSRSVRARGLAGLAEIAYAKGEHRQAIDLLDEASSIHPSGSVAVADTLGRAYAHVGELETAIGVFEKALEDTRSRGDSMEVLRFSVLLANALIDAGRYGRATELLGDALAATADAHDPIVQARIWWSQSRLHENQGDSETAVRYARRALQTLALTEHSGYTARAHQLLAHIELDRGNAAEALELLKTGYPLVERSGNRYERAMFRIEQARALAQLGQGEEAASLAMEASGSIAESSPSDAARGYALVAEVFAGLGDPARALELYELADESGPIDSQARRHLATRRAELLEQQGRKDEALEVLKRAMQAQTDVRAPQSP